MLTEAATPMLDAVLAAAQQEDLLLTAGPMRTAAMHLASVAAQHTDSVLCPVGAGGDRLIGAATVLAADPIQARGWHTELAGRTAVLVATVGVSPFQVEREIAECLRRGAHNTIVCALDSRLDNGQADEFVLLDTAAVYHPREQARSA